MYSRFGLPDEERDWESYFYGNRNDEFLQNIRSKEDSEIHDLVEEDISEGNEEMVLIQDVILPLPIINSTENGERNSSQSYSDDNVTDYHFSRLSKPFNSAKYVIEETEDGFYIVNVRSKNRMFLTKIGTLPGGVIIVNKELDKKTFTIIKTVALSTINSPSSRIIGTLRKEGLLMKFTAFDKSVSNITVSV